MTSRRGAEVEKWAQGKGLPFSLGARRAFTEITAKASKSQVSLAGFKAWLLNNRFLAIPGPRVRQEIQIAKFVSTCPSAVSRQKLRRVK